MDGKKKGPHSSVSLDKEEDYLRIQDVCDLINCSKTSAYRLANEGLIPTMKIGGMLRIPKKKLMRLIAEKSRNGDNSITAA